MHETAFSYSQLESPAEPDFLPPGPHRLRGWIWPKPGGHFADVRARVGPRLYPGVHGFPRPDLAAHFRTGRPTALAGFDVSLTLAPGDTAAVLEALSIEGRWIPFQTLACRPGPAPAEPAAAAAPAELVRWTDFVRGLEFLLRSIGATTPEGWDRAAATLAPEIPSPRELRPPEWPFIGFLDEPAATGPVRFCRLLVLGHLFHAVQPVRRILATADLQALHPLHYPQPSPAFAAHHAVHPAAACCGFHGWVDVPAQLPNPVAVRVYAETADGVLHLVQVRRTRRHDADLEKFNFPPHPATAFAEALAAWRRALAGLGRPVLEEPALTAAVERLRRDYERPAPIARPRSPATSSSIPRASLRHVVLASHNLNLEGAPLFLLEYARHLAAQGTRLTVLTPEDGPLRVRFEELGATITLAAAGPVFAAQSAEAARHAVRALPLATSFAGADLVVANTFTTFWAVLAAQEAGIPALCYVHESTTPAAFYRDRMHPAVVALIEAALAEADTVSFSTEATRRYHLGYGRTDNHVITPGWVDVARLDAWRAENPRSALRARFGLRPGELLVTNVGTVSDRKGQHTFARAVDLLWRRQPELAARARFVLLGGRDSLFDEQLRQLLADLDRPNLEVHPETPDYLPYFAAADLTVCSSHEESSPRVVLEAMACGTPLLASDVHGIPEFVRPDLEAVLVPAGDTAAWGEALARLLLSPGIGRDLADRARARVVQHFDAATVLPRHHALACRVASA